MGKQKKYGCTVRLPRNTYDLEAERAVIGSLLVYPDKGYQILARLRANDFIDPIYSCALEVIRDLTPEKADLYLVSKEVANRLQANENIVTDRLAEAAEHFVAVREIPRRVELLKKLTIRRNFELRYQQIRRERDPDKALKLLQKALHENVEYLSETLDEKDLVELMKEVAEKVEKARKASGSQEEGFLPAVRKMPTGWPGLDNLLNGGLHPGDYVVVAARTSTGKTSFLLSLAHQLTEPVAFFSLEMPEEQVAIRVLSIASGIPYHRILNAEVTDEEMAVISNTLRNLTMNIVLDTDPDLTPKTLLSKVQAYKARYGIKVVMVDYLQRMLPDKRMESRQLEVAAISRSLKSIAMQMDVAVVVAAQTNREVEKRTDKRPTLADLRDSGAIEQDADVVMLLYRGDRHRESDWEFWEVESEFGYRHRITRVECHVDKNRNGPCGRVDLYMDLPTMHFSSTLPPEATRAPALALNAE